MRYILPIGRGVAVIALLLAVLTPLLPSALGQQVVFDVVTHTGNDTLFVGVEGTILFTIDPNGYELVGVVWPVIWEFTNGNIIGPMSPDSGDVLPSPAAVAAFESISWNGYAEATDPDTTLYGFIDFDNHGLIDSGTLWSLTFTPLDTGQIIVDSTSGRVPPAVGWPTAGEIGGTIAPSAYEPVTIYVAPCPVRMGDCNEDLDINSSDVIYLVNYMFKSGPDPLPMRTVGDVNCTGGLSGADVIWLVNYVFKSGPPPCACYVKII